MAEFLVPQRSTLPRREASLEEILPKRHLVRFVWKVLESMDFSAMEKLYVSMPGGRGRPPYHPRVLAALWIYGMTQGLETATAIAKACTIRDDFRWLAGGLFPCDQTLLNFLRMAQDTLPSIWVQVLKAMHHAGHIDLSTLAEDGTKLRANASPRSFHPAQEIDAVIEQLKVLVAQKLQELVPPHDCKRHQVQLRALQGKLRRAEQAAQELKDRASRRAESGHASPASTKATGLQRRASKFSRSDFRHDAERNVMVCPAGQELAFVGVYANDSGSGYTLFRRRNCGACALKAQCTEASGRVLKVPVDASADPTPVPPAATASSNSIETTADSENPAAASAPVSQVLAASPAAANPRASLTDPEAVLMLATSQKRFEPSYNADLTVTRDGVIVNQFLTKEPVDFGSFPRALPAVLSNLGRPGTWAADGHYSTVANLRLAEQSGVSLCAPLPERHPADKGKFARDDFRHDPQRDVLICPAGQELLKVGTYGEEDGHPYDLYARRDCGECPLKKQCTDARGRRVKHLHHLELVKALEARMEVMGETIKRFRGQTVEPVNAQIKLHGLGRFHVRGLARCATVLTLACIAHNLMKWKAREHRQALKQAS
jgi:transposase